VKKHSISIACLAALLAWAPAQAQEFKFASQNPKGHPVVTGMERFASWSKAAAR
jgi:TRAP-type C4-dicarboxylate transport system substrate-binding protein